jgi:hypothetical protein
MKELTSAELRVGDAYQSVREQSRRSAADARRDLRISLAGVSLVFENRETLVVALEEALRAERITDATRVAAEVDAFNRLVPAEGELIACLYVDAADQAELGGRLADAAGLDRAVYLDIGGSRAAAVAGPVDADAPAAAVSLLRFPLDEEMRRSLDAGADISAGIDHPSHRARAVLTAAQRQAVTACL